MREFVHSGQQSSETASEASDRNLSKLKAKLTVRDQELENLWQDLATEEIVPMQGFSEGDLLIKQMDRLRREQGRKVSFNLLDIIKSFSKEIVSKNPAVIEQIHKNKRKELFSILGEKRAPEVYDVNQDKEEDGKYAEVKIEADSLRRF